MEMQMNPKRFKFSPLSVCSVDDAGDGGDGGAGDGGTGSGGTPPAGVPQDRVDQIVKDRVEQTKRSTAEAIAKDLGMSVEDAKAMIADAKKRQDSEKSEAQRERDAAEAEKAAAVAEKSEAAKARHDANIERALLRALPKDLDDDKTDARVLKLGRLIDVEVGADAAAIKTAVDGLKTEWPELFGATAGEGQGGGNLPPGDPKGTPPKKTGQQDAFAKGAERAKSANGERQYSFLQS